MLSNIKLAIIGLGYVGLPLANEFGKKIRVIGFDKNKTRIANLIKGIDTTFEVDKKNLKSSKKLIFTNNIEDISQCNFFIISVPTPVTKKNLPDFRLLKKASKDVAIFLKPNDIVVYESTVYPGATEEVCAPILEKYSGLKFNKNFFLGYSPERINPGDKKHTLTSIVKIVAGSNPRTLKTIDSVYRLIIKAGTYKVSSIKVAEAAKVIENTQRDVNIALINEFANIFNKLGIDTEEILKAAETKWNFLSFRPGLVGGHCIGVDPYYLAYKAKSLKYKTKLILSGRSINNKMSNYVVSNLKKTMKDKKIPLTNSKILLMGLTFKENCPDIRNSKVIDIFYKLKKHKVKCDVFDPLANFADVKKEYGLSLLKKPRFFFYDSVILAVAHDIFFKMGIKNITRFCKKKHLIYDLKYMFPSKLTDLRM